MKRKHFYVFITTGALCATLILAFISVWNGVILLNNPSKDEYSVQGIDFSAMQNKIFD